MKKLFLFIVALFTLSSVHADLILHESFDRAVGDLNKGANTDMGSNTADWWTFSGTSKFIQVAEGSLSYQGYVDEGKGNKVAFNGSGADDFRQFQQITSGKVYVAAIINVDSLKQNATQDHFLSIGDASMSNMYARLYSSSVKPDDKFTGFKLGIAKNNENSVNRGWSDEVYTPKTNYLVVLEYEFVDGEKNDTVRLYVNPTKTNKVPVAQCNQEGTQTGKGANGQADAAFLSTVNLRQGAGTPQVVFIDEIKVATSWDELFGEGGDTPVENPVELTVSPKSVLFGEYGSVYVGETYTKTFTVTAKNLKGDITLATNDAQLTLDKTTIAKADAESEKGVEVTATLVPTALDYPANKVTISLTTEGAAASVSASWWASQATTCATIAELKKEAAKGEGETLTLKFTGEAVVTYVTRLASGTTIYLQDATAAVSISDNYWPTTIQMGDKLTNFTVQEGYPAFGVQPLVPVNPSVTVVSSGNEVAPQVVTLAELKANAADYLLELVKVENVTLDQNSTKFGQRNDDNTPIADTFTQDGVTATINLVEGNDLIGTTKPKKADVIGISSNAAGSVIRVRGVSDIISKDNPMAVDNIAIDWQAGDYEIYTISGQRVNELQAGVNIIRQGNNTYKVVR